MLHGKIGKDVFLSREVDLYFHDLYHGFGSPKNTLAYVNYLKNDLRYYDAQVSQSEDKAAMVLAADLEKLVGLYGPLTVCGVPRSKREDTYPFEKTGLKRAIRKAIAMNVDLSDGLDYVVRYTNTLCTHRSYWGHGGDGEGPRPGLLRDTCHLSSDIAGKDIVLVDDIYTANVGIDEDAVQALLDAGAKSVVLYAFGCTARHGYRKCA
ncbi:MAG: amidophosphoribosyltransferase [Kiritimatiellae bacterium]|nr:amidophosphoribosyltransferase [Kiritimatiellia bacterium]